MVTLRPARGFTLPELVTVLGVMAILAALAAPAYGNLVATMRARSVSTDLYTALNRARSEAIKRNAAVTISPNEEGRWHTGWSILDPMNAGGVLDDYPAVPGAAIAGPDNVVYLPNGRVSGADLPRFDISLDGHDDHRCVSVDLSGRPGQTTSACEP
jgi:type IV fimbrial biogenesis protein FimT